MHALRTIRYGTTGCPIKRDVIRLKDGLTLDLAPPLVTACKVVPPNSANIPSPPKQIQTSSAWTIKRLKEKMAEALDCDKQATSRIWLIDSDTVKTAISSTITPEVLAHAWLEPAADEEVLRYSSLTGEATLAIEVANEDGSWLVKNAATEPAETLTVKRKPFFGGKGFYDEMTAKAQQKRAALTTDNMNNQDDQPVASTSSLAAPSLRVTRSQTGSSGSKKGLVGLTNLGNTCFVS